MLFVTHLCSHIIPFLAVLLGLGEEGSGVIEYVLQRPLPYKGTVRFFLILHKNPRSVSWTILGPARRGHYALSASSVAPAAIGGVVTRGTSLLAEGAGFPTARMGSVLGLVENDGMGGVLGPFHRSGPSEYLE